jgi:hypothetical protein
MPISGNFTYGTRKYGRAVATYSPGPLPEEVFVMQPAALDPRTPLMSVNATGHFRRTWMFRMKRTPPWTAPHKRRITQEVYPFVEQRRNDTPCMTYISARFACAVHLWQGLTPAQRKPYNDHVARYGDVMSGYNRFISEYLKALRGLPENPCKGPPRPDSRRLRRKPGRS